MKILPENKTFLYTVVLVIVILVVYKVVFNGREEITSKRKPVQAKNFTELFDLVKRENVIRTRHAGLAKANNEWQKVFLRGERMDACLALLRHAEGWVKDSQLKNESTRMLLDMPAKEGFPMVGLEIRGSSSFVSVRDFLSCIEKAPVAVTVDQLHLEKAKEDKAVKFQIRIIAPSLQEKGAAKL